MTRSDYRAALEAAIEEYESLGEERRRIDDRLAQLAQTITTLSRLLGLTPTVPMGLTDACRLVCRTAGVPLSPTEVRGRLTAIGFDLSSYSNEMAAIHTVLKRLREAGELQSVEGAVGRQGKPAYAWRPPVRTIAISNEVAEFLRGAGPLRAGEDRAGGRAGGRRKKR